MASKCVDVPHAKAMIVNGRRRRDRRGLYSPRTGAHKRSAPATPHHKVSAAIPVQHGYYFAPKFTGVHPNCNESMHNKHGPTQGGLSLQLTALAPDQGQAILFQVV